MLANTTKSLNVLTVTYITLASVKKVWGNCSGDKSVGKGGETGQTNKPPQPSSLAITEMLAQRNDDAEFVGFGKL